ncbi:MAG: ABC transporter ATP-binding protein [Patescibacteria group bacterium]
MAKRLSKNVMIRVEGLHKEFVLPNQKSDSIKKRITQIFKKRDGGHTYNKALDGISFDINRGDFFGIVGRNGSGKSTLLKIISEIYQPTSGSVTRRGSIVAFIELGVGFNPQLSGRDNVYLNGAMLGFDRAQVDEMYDDIVAFAELEKFMDLELKNYSSGMRVRLAFSIAIRADADVLVLDEVLAVGDKAFRAKCYNYFQNLKDNNKTIIFVTHSMPQVEKYCNKAILIENGKIAHEGSASEVAEKYLELFS